MKWFKHHSDMSMNDKIGKLEAEFGLIGYAVFLKILELCAMNWDEISDPEFSFNSSRVQLVLGLKSTRTELILSLCSTLNLFHYEKIGKNYNFKVPKLAEVKARYQKKNHIESTQNPHKSNPNKKGEREGDNKKGEGDKEKDYEAESELLDFWNSHEIIVHKKTDKLLDSLTPKILKVHEAGYDLLQIREAITNYASILKHPDSFFKYEWSLDEFLTRAGSLKFYPGRFRPANFINSKPQGKQTTEQYGDRMMAAYRPREAVNG